MIEWEDPRSIAAIIVEPISNTGGIITPPLEYLKILRQLCDEFNILLIFDEIITGFGRTGACSRPTPSASRRTSSAAGRA